MRVLVVLLNFGTSQLKYLEQVLNEYKSMEYSLDIVIHSNIPLVYKNVEVKVFQFKDDRQLQFTTRQTIYDNKDKYDLFIFSENDLLISKKNVESFLKVTKVLPKNYIAGFFQCEEYKEGLFYPAYHNPFKWDETSVLKIGDYVFAHFTNVHQGCYVLNKEQLNQIIKNFDYVKKDASEYIKEIAFNKLPNRVKLKSIMENTANFKNKLLIMVGIALILIIPRKFLDKLKKILIMFKKKYSPNKLDFLNKYLEEGQYGIFESAGSEIYLKGGFKKVISISHFDDFLIYHLPNKYKGKLGKFDNVMRRDIEYLISRAK